MAPARVKPDRAEQVQACLATVMDPELDESVTELGFVTEVVVHGDGAVLDLEAKKKILGLNAARLYDIDIAAQKKLLAKERVPARIAVAA